MIIRVVLRVFGRATSCRCRPRRSPVAGGTRLHPRQLLLDLGNLLKDGGHGLGVLVFEDVVVFGMVVFGVLIVGAGFFMRVFVSRLPRFGRSDAYAVAILLLCDIGRVLGRDFVRNSKGTLFNVFQNRRSLKWLFWGFVPKITWRKGSISQ